MRATSNGARSKVGAYAPQGPNHSIFAPNVVRRSRIASDGKHGQLHSSCQRLRAPFAASRGPGTGQSLPDNHHNSTACGAGSRLAVIGLGYIGLPTAAVAARAGLRVTGVDIEPTVVTAVNRGEAHIRETDLDTLLLEMVSEGKLLAAGAPVPADVFLIAVPTPLREGNRPDISFVMDAARSIAPVLERGNTVILESTSPVGTTDAVRDLLAELRPDLALPYADSNSHDVHVAYCPERVLPGRTLAELVNNDRAIGGITEACAQAAQGFYEEFVQGECTRTTARVAEMVKLAENSFRDVNIAFANELSLLAEGLGVDIWEVIRLANRHPRVDILQPGPGVGGHCIAVDPWFLVASDPDNSALVRTAREVNDGKTQHVIRRARKLVSDHPGVRVTCFGLAFKPEIDDFRESPALAVAAALAAELGDRLSIVEPFAHSLPPGLASTGASLISLEEALAEKGIALMLVDHKAFKQIDRERLSNQIVYDTRGIW